MGRDTAIYMLCKKKATTNLYNDLKHKRIHERTFKELTEENIQEYGSFHELYNDPNPIHNGLELYEKILDTVKEDINHISPEALSLIIYYLTTELTYGKYDNTGLHGINDTELRTKNYNKVNEIFEEYGISLLYEIHKSTVCYSYMFQIGNFDDFFPAFSERETIHFEGGYNMCSTYFLIFNDYMILIMNKIIKSKLFKDDVGESVYQETKKNEIAEVIKKYKNNQRMQNSIECAFYHLKSSMYRDDLHIEKNTVYWANLFLDQSLEMKRRINPKTHKRIVIVDSY